ncbi:ETC complex I subunit [Cognatishimia sp. SS12]|uniref:ETC complex I subunit n=1 Tax=Cognatishimia sp. SS12 TaxID=2979465 RepID=UPI00233002CD|nr:ETC complex I subunit [Cognatishimia sp. SS12]MDC0738135.1 ETC complex I subunit [Cognatishimia sp. SS12]
MIARIYQPARNAMTSGTAKTKTWVLEYAQAAARDIDPLMGWTGSNDTQSQVKLRFSSKEAALEYAKEHGIQAQVTEPNKRKPVIRKGGYGENFATDRRAPWTH